jgi:hypothetical protein
MRFDQLSGWTLMAIQAIALVVVTPTLLLIGIAFRRSRVARWGSMLAAVVVGGVIAATTLHADERVVASYLFASILFLLGTVMMSVFLLAAIPQTRGAAPGAIVAGGLLIVAFVLTYWTLATFTPLKWLQSTS